MLVWRIVTGKPGRCIRPAGQAIGDTNSLPPLSVIVCVKNKFQKVDKFLPALLEQNYPQFEVIIVADGYSDDNDLIIGSLLHQFDNLYLTRIPDDTRNISRKKLGLTLGIKAAQYDCLVFTEADSLPASADWLRGLASHFDGTHSIVLGLSALELRKGYLTNFCAYDYFLTNLQWLAFALFRHPFAGNGRNMAYHRSHFDNHKGFSRYRILPQGEDDLYINEIADGRNTAVELSPESTVLSNLSNYEWENWKTDRAATSRYYRRGPVAFWRLSAWMEFLFALSVLACIAVGWPFTAPFDYILPATAVICRIVLSGTKAFIINRTAEKAGLKSFGLAVIVYEWIRFFSDLKFYFFQLFKKTNKLYDKI
jgi:glycosyltransferase involved in cell wall biosynthesis